MARQRSRRINALCLSPYIHRPKEKRDIGVLSSQLYSSAVLKSRASLWAAATTIQYQKVGATEYPHLQRVRRIIRYGRVQRWCMTLPRLATGATLRRWLTLLTLTLSFLRLRILQCRQDILIPIHNGAIMPTRTLYGWQHQCARTEFGLIGR